MTTEDEAALRTTAWRQRLGLQGASLEGGLESADTAGGEPAGERIRRARDEMKRLVIENFGGDAALLDAIQDVVLTSEQAVKVLEGDDRTPTPEEFSSLEAIVSFDGTRPSFLVRDGEIDLESSFSTSQWKTTLAPRRAQLAAFASCVGRVELDGQGIGTAFLITPTVAITNRHVAQAIAHFGDAGIVLRPGACLDFGREHRGRGSFDSRKILRILSAGAAQVAAPVDHGKLDLALLQVEASLSSSGALRDRRLDLQLQATEVAAGATIVAVGYPADWRRFVPSGFVAKHDEVIARLLEGDGGSKRLAPGESAGMLTAAPGAATRTTTHDATTLNGNSGSPLGVLAGAGPLRAVGLHYGGQWHGERTNWAHVLAACASAPMTDGRDLRSALAEHGLTA